VSAVHVHPLNDLVEHDTSEDSECVCGPESRPVKQGDGSVGWLIGVHPSGDA
jgi:hypothetical protein